MKIKSLILCFIFVLMAKPVFSKDIKSIEIFELSLTNCFNSMPTNNACLSELIKNHLPDGNDGIKPIADQVEIFFIKWLDQETVENVYKTDQRDIGAFISYRNYIIEDSSASVILLEMTYRRVLGLWYVMSFNINSTQKEIREVLNY